MQQNISTRTHNYSRRREKERIRTEHFKLTSIPLFYSMLAKRKMKIHTKKYNLKKNRIECAHVMKCK
jgi:hypothetical protein